MKFVREKDDPYLCFVERAGPTVQGDEIAISFLPRSGLWEGRITFSFPLSDAEKLAPMLVDCIAKAKELAREHKRKN